MLNLMQNITRSDSSRRQTYKDINPEFTVHDIYKTKHTVDEIHRLSFTKFRVSGHSLVCETGRWNRRGRGRLPLEERLCMCGEIQTERHVVENCIFTSNVRNTYNFRAIKDLFQGNFAPDVTCKIIHLILSTYY